MSSGLCAWQAVTVIHNREAARIYSDLLARMGNWEETNAASDMPTRVQTTLRIRTAGKDPA